VRKIDSERTAGGDGKKMKKHRKGLKGRLEDLKHGRKKRFQEGIKGARLEGTGNRRGFKRERPKREAKKRFRRHR